MSSGKNVGKVGIVAGDLPLRLWPDKVRLSGCGV